jgi:death-on-curing family protein
MSNIDISYPTKEDIELWISILRQENTQLKLKLPHDDSHWYDHVCSAVLRIQNDYTHDLHEKAARLFYYLNKGHHFVDGNKRTAIVVTYLFLLLNNRWITHPRKIETLAKQLAQSHGSVRIDYWMQKIKQVLESVTVVIPQD